MLTQLFPKYHPRYTASPSAHWLDAFADWLIANGYAPQPAKHHVRRLKETLELYPPVAITDKFAASTLPQMFTRRNRQAYYRATQRAFQRCLTQCGAITIEPTRDRFAPLLSGYRNYLIELRGFAPSTVAQHMTTSSTFIARAVPSRLRRLDLSAAAVERFVAAEGHRVSRQSLQHIVARRRTFLRYCFDQGVCSQIPAIDTPRT